MDRIHRSVNALSLGERGGVRELFEYNFSGGTDHAQKNLLPVCHRSICSCKLTAFTATLNFSTY